MSATPQLCENPCETCAKEGLPLLLTRYALMPKETGAPMLTGHMQDLDLTKVPLGEGAHYGLRLLRSGYVYVYDEARKHWDEYFVTADGYLSKMPPRTWALKVQQRPATEFRCARNGAAPLAGVITIRNPKHATRVWIAFSNAEWTHAVFKKHDSADHRAQHMRCITISGGKVAPQAGTAPLTELKQHVTEFKMEQTSAAKAFAKWCPHPYNGRQFAAEGLLQAVQRVRPQGGSAIVALHDPVGLAQEIAGLMVFRKEAEMNRPSLAKPLFAASVIETQEAQIKAQARLAAMLGTASVADDMEGRYGLAGSGLTGGEPQLATLLRDSMTPTHLENIAKKRWREYTHSIRGTGTPRIDEKSAKDWLAKHRAVIQALDGKLIAPLARAHAAWMQSPCMISHLSCTHDSQNLDSGVAFTASVLSAMDHTWDMLPSYDLYLKWVKEGSASSQNIVMRALALNQDATVALLQKVDRPSIDSRAFPSDAIFSGLASHFSGLSKQAKAVHAKLLAGLSGVAIKYWDEFQSGKISPAFAAAMAGASGKQIVRLPLIGSRSQLIESYVLQIVRLNPGMLMDQNQLRQAVAAQTRLLHLQGVKLNETRKLAWFVLLDADAAREVLGRAKIQGLSGQALADELVRTAMRSPQAVRDMELNAINAMTQATRTGVAATALGAVLMGWNYTKLEEDLAQGMSHELFEAEFKLWAGRTTLIGFTSEQLGKVLQAQGEQRLKNAPGLNLVKIGKMLTTWGSRVSLLAGIALGVWDASKAIEEFKKGDGAMAFAYGLSGGTAAVLSIYVFWAASFGFAGWFMLGLVLLVTLYVEVKKDNKLQDWLLRSHFGTADNADKYKDSRTQMDQYRLAIQQ